MKIINIHIANNLNFVYDIFNLFLFIIPQIFD
jgi:hypothetical protein